MRLYCSVALFCLVVSFSSCQSNAPKPLIGEFKIGERAQVGSLIYNVFETQYLLKVGEGNGPDVHVPKNRFFLVHLTAVNSGGADSDVSVPTFSLIDDAGESYMELPNGAGLSQWLGLSRKVRPAESITGDIVFDVAPKHYKLRISDDNDQHYALVDLPLSFGETTPTVESTTTPR